MDYFINTRLLLDDFRILFFMDEGGTSAARQRDLGFPSIIVCNCWQRF